ncbi:Peptidoglycan binding domain containing protein [Coniochaeta hoffmannii]|uniref:Peptidoglycan binding domain containing protein n=1 Tax=Coniochaeta hoffmannii TaxID=91930 RepID=A0AA38SET9_9PEZI|nr:Peptidoglycan binding domain containing protein [Coniochaeta hoffmannii]
MAEPPRPRIVLLCDGTWCGREAGTRTNIYRLAELFGVDMDASDSDSTVPQERRYDDGDEEHRIHVRYRHGVGLGSGFLDYLFDGATAQDLAAEVVAAYRYVVKHYTPGCEVWMFGVSRGAYTARCVAGLINNCGVLRRDRLDGGGETADVLCREAYRLYRSEDPLHAPHSEQMVAFRKRFSWPLIGDDVEKGEDTPRAPVRFMGLFDTVGGLGIPTWTGGVGLEWPEFHNNEVSSVVQDVCHLVSLHDRFWIFQPCLATRKDPGSQGIDEEWVPGAHYDLARQRFQFWRSGASWVERVIGAVQSIPFLGSGKQIEPNEVLSDLAMWKMVERIARHDAGHQLITEATLVATMGDLRAAMTGPRRRAGSGDVYENIVEYGPGGSRIGRLVTQVAGGLDIWKLLFEIRERMIPNDGAKVYRFGAVDPVVLGSQAVQCVGQLAAIDEVRYPSHTPELWALRSGKHWP